MTIIVFASSLSAAPLSVAVSRAGTATPVRALEKIEFDVTLSGGKAPYANPYDADEVALDAILTGPGGRRLQIPAFWEVPQQRVTLEKGRVEMGPSATGKSGWRVRLRPTVAGKWTLAVAARDAAGKATSAPLVFTVAPAKATQHGFVERATGAGRARYFQLTDGAPYFAVGENVCWSWGKGLADYDEWFGALGKAKANFARLWMAFNPLESKETGLRRYDQKNAAYFDEVLSLAEKQGLTCMLAFGTYGEFITGGVFGEGKWEVNAYNAANGGPVAADKPQDFFTDPTARAAYRNRLRYIVARYGAFTGVGFWELWNEKDAPAAWLGEMAAFLKQNDPYRRPITNSYSSTGPASVWNLPDMDLSQTHRYGDEGSLRDIASGMPSDARSHDAFRKPHLMGEFGITWRGPDTKFDPQGTGTNLHNGLWASALAGNAGSAMVWWWDSYVHPKNLVHEFTPLADFARKIDWPRRAFEPLDLPVPTRRVAREEFSDLKLEPSGGWGARSVAPVEIAGDGGLRGAGTLLSHLYNVNGTAPDKKEFQGPQELTVKMPRDGTMRLNIGTVSVSGELRVKVDGQIAATFRFDASPAGAGSYQETKLLPEYGIYQARFDTTREVPLGAGAHRIVLENVGGDWIEIKSYEFTGLRSSRLTSLRTTALQDKTSGETLVWIQDPDSNWKSDFDGKKLDSWQGVTLFVPVSRQGAHRIEWWDTHVGRSIGAQTTVHPKAGQLSLSIPPFSRDVALRIVAATP